MAGEGHAEVAGVEEGVEVGKDAEVGEGEEEGVEGMVTAIAPPE